MNVESLANVGLALAPALERSGQSPLEFAGRVAGLGADQMKAGIPKWAWLGIGIVAGTTVMWVWGDEIKRAVGRKRKTEL